MSEEERQAIIHLLDKQARYEYARKNNISFSDEDYEAYIIRQSMIDKDKEIEKLNKIIEIKNNRIQQLMKRTRSARIDKAIEYIEEKEKDDDNWIEYELLVEPSVIKDILKGE